MFTNISSRKVYEQVIDQIQKNIISGELKKGDKLPSERELSEQMNISRTSIREAIRVLESMGVVESIHGEGNFICFNSEKSLLQPLSMIFMLNNGTYQDVFELRKILEIESTRLAALRVNDEDCKDLRYIIKSMENELDNKKRNDVLVELDKNFHSKIAQMSKNNLIESLYNTSSMLFEKFIKDARLEMIRKDSEAEKLLLIQHRQICNAIIKRNVNLSAQRMEEHMDYIEKDYLSSINNL